MSWVSSALVISANPEVLDLSKGAEQLNSTRLAKIPAVETSSVFTDGLRQRASKGKPREIPDFRPY
jgi:hypothetical protein